jgi:hypothetical protein
MGAAAARYGKVCHISFGIFEAYYEAGYTVHRDLVKRCIDDLMPEPRLVCKEIPATARVTLTQNKSYRFLHVKATYPEARGGASAIEEHNILPAGRKIRVKGEYKKVMLLPEQTELSFRTQSGYAEFTLPETRKRVDAILCELEFYLDRF